MKKLGLLLAITTALTGCLHTIETGHEETCARNGQIYEGFTVTHKDGKGQVRCRKAQDELEECVVRELKALEYEAHHHNKEVTLKNVGIVLGYTAYVLPGWYLYDRWNEDNEERLAEYAEEKSNLEGKCEKIVNGISPGKTLSLRPAIGFGAR